MARMINTITSNFNQDGCRYEYPLDFESVEEIKRQEPMLVVGTVALLSCCVSYLDGKPLHFCVRRAAGEIFCKLMTKEEFLDTFSRGDGSAA